MENLHIREVYAVARLPVASEVCTPEQVRNRATMRATTRHAEGAMARRGLGRWRYSVLLYLFPSPTWGGASPTWSHVGGAIM